MTRLMLAEILKLRRRTGMMALCAGVLLLAIGAYSIANVLDPPIGGPGRFDDAVGILTMLGSVIGVIVGATAGGADIESGVYRDLVATGTPRMRLLAARIPGAWAIVLPMLAVAVAFEAVWCGVGGEQLVTGVLTVLVSGAFTSAACVGMAALAGSRGPVMGIALAFQLGVSPLLVEVSALGDFRRAVPSVAIARIGNDDVLPGFTLALAVVILIAWLVVLLGAGAHRAQTQEI